MNTKTKGTFLVSTAMLGSVSSLLSVPIDQPESPLESSTHSKKWQHFNPIRFGDMNGSVYNLQGYLKAFDYYRGEHDGQFGLLTKEAIVAYQTKHHLEVTGVADEETMKHLLHSNDVQLNLQSSQLIQSIIYEQPNSLDNVLTTDEETTSLQGSSQHLFQIGDQGRQVEKYQQILEEYGYYTGVDGIYGPKTKEAVKLFQLTHDLKVDGIIGPETKAALTNEDDILTYEPEQIIEVQSNSELENSVDNQKSEKETMEKQEEPEAKSDHSSIIDTAESLIGTPYSWGGTTPSGFDCSGFIQYVFNQHNKELPRTTQDLYNQGSDVSSLQIGDIVFFTTYRSGPSHAGIYLGNQQFIHAGSSTGVTISSLDQNYWAERYLGAKRF